MNLKNIFVSLILSLILISCGGGGSIENSTSSNSINSNSDTTINNNESSEVKTTPNINMETIYRSFNVGFGGSGSFSFSRDNGDNNDPVWLNSTDLILDDNIENNREYQEIKYFDASNFDILQQKLKKSKFIVYWITKYWSESWNNLSTIQNAMDAGYIPVFNYWYFADELLGGLPDENEIQEYYEHNLRISRFLSKLHGTKFVIMEPEFNKNTVIDDKSNQDKFISIISNAIDNIKNNTSDVKFSLCMMDRGSRSVNSDSYENDKCGYENCALGDKEEWDKLEYIYNSLLSKLDFISFEEMIAQFNKTVNTPYSNDDIGIEYLDTRVSNFSKYLKDKYNKPIFMPYIAVATATWSDENSDGKIDNSELDLSGWEDEADNFYKNLMQKRDELLENGLFGFAVMSLFDDPTHDINGYQYYANNEYHLGIIKSSAQDEVDKYSFGDIEFKRDIVETIFGD
ncbi:hypothetical protein MNB_SV-15-132 [hydrothermal vent metagenome]|uniref:Uncharacterized protein n=1 Tax=hydrothermal vent metagenome TaxID=652676 RepID=A0A1W1EL41_9ZZZZ